MIMVMGVAGSGKSTVAENLARELHWKFVDADDFHSELRKRIMGRGIPLTTEQRRPWLNRVARHIKLYHHRRGNNIVLACSALRGVYREQLTEGVSGLKLVCITASFDVLKDRLLKRKDHFFKYDPILLQAQLDAFEEPKGKDILRFKINESLDNDSDPLLVSRTITREILQRLNLRQ